jgi:hypothetical protein
MIYSINNKENEMVGCGYDSFMVHYLFIEKRWNKDNYIILDSNNNSFTYKEFSKLNEI